MTGQKNARHQSTTYFNRETFLHTLGSQFCIPRVGTNCASNEFFFVVSYLDTNFFKPARLSDNLKVETFLIENSFCSIKLKQQIFRELLLITDINVKLVWINGQTTKPAKIPENIIARFNSLEVV